MSGGAFDYKQHYIGDIADEIEQTIIEAGRKIPHEILSRNYWYGRSTFDKEETYPMYERKTIEIMKRAVYVLRMAHIYAQRIDWMLSCDDTEDTYPEVVGIKDGVDERWALSFCPWAVAREILDVAKKV